MNKYFTFLAFALMATFGLTFVSCSDDSKDDGGGSDDYSVKMPSGTTGITIEPLSDAEISKLKSKGYTVVGTPINVTQNGSDHVVLDKMATVSFKIPENYPKEKYNELVGVIIGEDGPEYVVPDIYGLREGVVRFQTYHFCEVAAVKDKDELNKLFVNYTAVNDWNANLREQDFNTLGDRLKAIAEESGFGENDLLGIAFREVLGDNDYVKKTMQYVEAYDEGSFSDNAVKEISEKLDKEIKAKILTVLFGKLKTDPDNKVVKDFLQEHLNQENMEDIGKRLGEGQNPSTIAWEYGQGFVIERLKEFSIKQVPYIKAVQATATAVKIGVKFWGNQKNLMLYNQYEELCNQYHGVISANEWNDEIAWQLSNSNTLFGMSLDEVREQFEKRYTDKVTIDKKKAEIQKVVDLWTTTNNGETSILVDNDKYFGENCDYIQRLTRLHTLMERFRKELVVDGVLYWKDDGVQQLAEAKYSLGRINRQLITVMEKYMEMYPDEKGFYKWLAENGYLDKKINKQVDDMEEMRAWWLIETVINRHEDTSRDNGQFVDYMHYTASETEQTMSGMCTGMKSYYEYVQQPVAFFSTIQAPPAYMEAGEKLVLHCTVKRTSPEAYCHIEVSPWMTWESDYSQTWADKVNVVGAKGVGTRDIHAEEGEWDFEVSISGGSKNQKRTLILGDACQSQIRWVYKWCSVFEKD